MATAYKTRRLDAPLLARAGIDRLEQAPDKARQTQRYTPRYAVTALLDHERTRSMLDGVMRCSDLCAGDGAMLRHFRAEYSGRGWPWRQRWTLGDIVPSARLQALSGDAEVSNPSDLFARTAIDPSMDAHVTNWPWYGFGRHVEHLRGIYPNAVIAGISCDQDRRDGGRDQWWKCHRPSVIAALPGRLTFPEPGQRSTGKYPYTVSWYLWGRGVTDSASTEYIWL